MELDYNCYMEKKQDCKCRWTCFLNMVGLTLSMSFPLGKTSATDTCPLKDIIELRLALLLPQPSLQSPWKIRVPINGGETAFISVSHFKKSASIHVGGRNWDTNCCSPILDVLICIQLWFYAVQFLIPDFINSKLPRKTQTSTALEGCLADLHNETCSLKKIVEKSTCKLICLLAY